MLSESVSLANGTTFAAFFFIVPLLN